MAQIHFLGTGTSTGVPQVGCTCEVCRSADPHDNRLRTSALVETDGGARILIDCGPDFRQQMLATPPFRPLDAVLITHEHYDHVGGIDDLRPYSAYGEVNIYAEPHCSKELRERLPYCFVEHKYPGVPNISLHDINPGEPFTVAGEQIVPVRVMHGRLPIVGFRLGRLGYITDMSQMPDESLALLQGIDLLVINALRRKPHPSHQSLDQALAVAARIGARRTYFIHMSHEMGLHEATCAELPSGTALAYDGLTLTY